MDGSVEAAAGLEIDILGRTLTDGEFELLGPSRISNAQSIRNSLSDALLLQLSRFVCRALNVERGRHLQVNGCELDFVE